MPAYAVFECKKKSNASSLSKDAVTFHLMNRSHIDLEDGLMMSATAYCRTCACRAEGPHRLRSFSVPCAAADSLLALVHNVNTGVRRGDGLPQNVCLQCMRRLRTIRDFIIKVETAQDVLASMFPKGPYLDSDLDLTNVPQSPVYDTNIKEEPNEDAAYMTKDLLFDEMAVASILNTNVSESEIIDDTQEVSLNNETITKPEYFVTIYDIKKKEHVHSSSDGNSSDDDNSDVRSEQELLLKYEEVKTEFTDIPNMINNSDTEDLTNDDKREQPKLSQERTVQVKAEISHDNINSVSEQSPANNYVNDESFQNRFYSNIPFVLHSPKKSNDASLPVWKDYLICKRCKKSTVSIQDLIDHSMEEHTSCVPFKCVKCSVRIVSRKHFFQHMYKHDDTLIQCCEYCGERFVSASDAIWHMETKHAVKKKIFQCLSCETGFDTIGELKCHQDTFIRRSKRRCICDHCKQEFTNKCTLIVHIERHYPSKHICKICNKSFKSKFILQQHHDIHKTTMNHICQVCGKGFKQKSQYKVHQSIHSDVKPYECDICKKRFKLASQVKRHKQCHGPPLFKCESCGKAFRYQSSFKAHLRMHSNEKPYACDMCNKKFANWSNYNTHMKRIHRQNMAKTKLANIVLS